MQKVVRFVDDILIVSNSNYDHLVRCERMLKMIKAVYCKLKPAES